MIGSNFHKNRTDEWWMVRVSVEDIVGQHDGGPRSDLIFEMLESEITFTGQTVPKGRFGSLVKYRVEN